jgi:hypothetical protein
MLHGGLLNFDGINGISEGNFDMRDMKADEGEIFWIGLI